MVGLIILFICLFCIYLAIGYTSALLAEAEDDTLFTILFTLCWPIVWPVIITFYIVFTSIFTFISRSGINEKYVSKR